MSGSIMELIGLRIGKNFVKFLRSELAGGRAFAF